MLSPDERIRQHLAGGNPVWLFLDYDGTLADFAPTPDDVIPEPKVIHLLQRLVDAALIRVSVISGRRLSHIEKLLPIKGILLAGTYGIEIKRMNGEKEFREQYAVIRPPLESIKPEWMGLIEGRAGFYLEDKGWTLALHARDADEFEAEEMIDAARAIASEHAGSGMRLLGGHRFLEIGALLADKGETVLYLVEQYPLPDALLVYLGDDDKDEEAFQVIHEQGGLSILVSREPRPTAADWRLDTPQDALRWLETLLS